MRSRRYPLSWGAAMLRVRVRTQSFEKKRAGQSTMNDGVAVQHTDKMMASGRHGRSCLFEGLHGGDFTRIAGAVSERRTIC